MRPAVVALVPALSFALACGSAEAPPAEAPPAEAPPAEAPPAAPAAPTGPLAGAIAEAEWGKPFYVVILADAAAVERATAAGLPTTAIGEGLDCGTGLSAEQVGLAADAIPKWGRFDTEAHAKVLADAIGGRVFPATDACGG